MLFKNDRFARMIGAFKYYIVRRNKRHEQCCELQTRRFYGDVASVSNKTTSPSDFSLKFVRFLLLCTKNDS